jgi:intron-binding protein aquarius
LDDFTIRKVGIPAIGENKPSYVWAQVDYTLERFKGKIREEWEEIRQHDNLFLVSLQPKAMLGEKIDTSLPFPEQYGVKYIRGCEVIEVFDENGDVIKEFDPNQGRGAGNKRTLKVSLDCSQYQLDMDLKDEDVYGSFQFIIRRKPKENNFKAVLETIRDLMNTNTIIPEWLHDMFLGYGDPTEKNQTLELLDFKDTFLDINHLIQCFPGIVKKLLITLAYIPLR